MPPILAPIPAMSKFDFSEPPVRGVMHDGH
jgi:hypothetical protein